MPDVTIAVEMMPFNIQAISCHDKSWNTWMFTVYVFRITPEVSLIKASEQYGLFLYTFSSPQTIVLWIRL